MEVPSERNICGLLHSEKRAGGEGEAEGTGDREDVVLMEQLSRETRGNGFRSPGGRDWMRGAPSAPRQEGGGGGDTRRGMHRAQGRLEPHLY